MKSVIHFKMAGTGKERKDDRKKREKGADLHHSTLLYHLLRSGPLLLLLIFNNGLNSVLSNVWPCSIASCEGKSFFSYGSAGTKNLSGTASGTVAASEFLLRLFLCFSRLATANPPSTSIAPTAYRQLLSFGNNTN